MIFVWSICTYIHLVHTCLFPNVLDLSSSGNGQKMQCVDCDLSFQWTLAKPCPQRRFRLLVIFHSGASYKCWLISEGWENIEEIGSIYWNTVVYVYVYVFCRCFCLIIFLVSLFPLSKESLPVIRESFQSQDWFSPLLSFLFTSMSYSCVCVILSILTRAKTGKDS